MISLPTCNCNKVRLYADDVLLYCYMYTQGKTSSHYSETWMLLKSGQLNGKCLSTPPNVNLYVSQTRRALRISYTYHITDFPFKEVTTTSVD